MKQMGGHSSAAPPSACRSGQRGRGSEGPIGVSASVQQGGGMKQMGGHSSAAPPSACQSVLGQGRTGVEKWVWECSTTASLSACRVPHAPAGRRVHSLTCPHTVFHTFLHFLSRFLTHAPTLFTLVCRTLVDDTHWSPPAAAPPAPAPAPPPPPAPSAPPRPCACSRAATVKMSLLRRTWEQVVQGKSSSCAPAPSCPAMHCVGGACKGRDCKERRRRGTIGQAT